MDCTCNSKNLYSSHYKDPNQVFNFKGKDVLSRRTILPEKEDTVEQKKIIEKIIESSQLWLPSQIQKITWDEVEFNPMWFYKKYISKNTPCIITNIFEGDDIFERWGEPQYLEQVLVDEQQSISLTPDGFADSIRGDCFIEPFESQGSIKSFFNCEECYPNAIPYIQHQNSNLTQQFSTLNAEVSQNVVRTVSNYFFKGKEPDAQNLWLGSDQSVSSLHKDPYENFYLPIVGEKHFTLLPPISILSLEEQEYLPCKWEYTIQQKVGHFTCVQNGEHCNKWICQNPDLLEDLGTFGRLKEVKKYHVVVQKEEMLYLPSLWYHQVSQCKGKDPYTLAINYWFDMEFNQNFTLYEAARMLRNL